MSLNKFSWCIATLSHLETLPVSFSLFHLRLWPGGSGTIYPLSPNRLTLPKTALYAKKHMHTTANSYRCIVILTASRSPTRNTHLGFSRRMASTYPKGLGCLSGILFCYLSDTFLIMLPNATPIPSGMRPFLKELVYMLFVNPDFYAALRGMFCV